MVQSSQGIENRDTRPGSTWIEVQAILKYLFSMKVSSAKPEVRMENPIFMLYYK